MTDREAVIEILNYLHLTNPCCSCCGSADAYDEAAAFAANIGTEIGLTKEEYTMFQCHDLVKPCSSQNAKCSFCRTWTEYKFVDKAV